ADDQGERCLFHPGLDRRIPVTTAAAPPGVTAWDAFGWIADNLKDALVRHVDLFVYEAAVRGLLDRSSELWPTLVAATRTRYATAEITDLLRRLLGEEVSIRNLRRVLQAICDFDTIVTDPRDQIIID